jgi:1-acyl-sn-glycerol-3-phosphate acyltransferase
MPTQDLHNTADQQFVLWKRLFPLYRWSIIAPYLALSTLVIGTTIVPIALAGFPVWASRVLGRLWARTNMAVSLIEVSVIGAHKVDPSRSYVIVANHQSLVDIYVLYGHLRDIKWVMKKELRAIPVLGAACEAMGHIIIDRSNTEAAVQSINDARAHIRDGISIVFFPEGTRSRNGELGTFKKGAFRLAQELGIPVLPLTIHNTHRVLPSDTTDIVPDKVRLEFNEPIETTALSSDDIAQLTAQSRETILAALTRGTTGAAP